MDNWVNVCVAQSLDQIWSSDIIRVLNEVYYLEVSTLQALRWLKGCTTNLQHDRVRQSYLSAPNHIVWLGMSQT